MELTLTWVVALFTLGFALQRSSSVRIALVAGLMLGVLWATGWWGELVHTLDGVFGSAV